MHKVKTWLKWCETLIDYCAQKHFTLHIYSHFNKENILSVIIKEFNNKRNFYNHLKTIIKDQSRNFVQDSSMEQKLA